MLIETIVVESTVTPSDALYQVNEWTAFSEDGEVDSTALWNISRAAEPLT